MEFKQIKELINLVNKTKISELKIEQKDFKINIRSKSFTKAIQSNKSDSPSYISAPPMQPQALPPVIPASPATTVNKAKENGAEAEAAVDDKLITIKSPMIGTFYRSPSPDKDAFVKIGDNIDKGTVLCMIEAMKLFNEIEAEITGKIVKVLIENNSPVEYDQPLFLVEPI